MSTSVVGSRFASHLLLTAAFALGCQGSGASVGMRPGTAGTGGASTGTGGTSPTGAGGTSPTGAGGTSPTGVGGTAGTGTGGSAGTGTAGAGGRGNPAPDGGGVAPPPAAGINGGAGPWGTPVAGGPAPGGMVVPSTVTVNRTTPTGNIGSGFLGFSIEKTHLTNSTYLAGNARLIALYNLIGPVNLRIGANDVERCTWVPNAPNAGGGPPYGMAIGTVMVDGLNDFLNATGAKVIYSLNFSLNNPANDALEATYARMRLGANLYGFEIGNELNKYGTWATLRTQYEAIATAVMNAVPDARFVGPALTAGDPTPFITPFAQNEVGRLGPRLVQLTQHYYIGAAGATTASASAMQIVNGSIPMIARILNTAATANNIADGWRLDEANSFYNHGLPGVSDTLIAALWSLDLMFVNAANGARGVNFHGGETGMDGTRPFTYQPIVETLGMVTEVRPVYLGMLMFYLAGQGRLLAASVAPATPTPNFTAYAVDYTADGSTTVVLNNKSATTGVQVTVNVGTEVASASAIYLQGSPAGVITAPAASVTLAGAGVTPQGTWARTAPFIQATSGNTVTVFVPAASAALVRVQ
jgi:hypothetical protein